MDEISGSSGSIQNPLDPVPISLRTIEGIDKLRRSIAKELKNGLTAVEDNKCSNLPQLLSILHYVISKEKSGNTPFAVLKPFYYTKNGHTTRFIVDVVSKDRNEWIKVSARNPKSLSLLAAGGGGFGQRSILDHARVYLLCSEQNHSFFKPPKVTFVFTNGIGSSLAQQLESLQIHVEGEIILDSELGTVARNKPYRTLFKPKIEMPDDSMEHFNEETSCNMEFSRLTLANDTSAEVQETCGYKNPSLEGITKLNLDITALLAFVSNLTNGHTEVRFKTTVLKQQLEFEKKRPQGEVLNKIFQGPAEKKRAEEFLKRVIVIPDNLSPRSKSLALVGNIKHRSLTIFGTGDSIGAVTVTANIGFFRSSISQGVEFPVFLHESRALTEGKENKL